MGKMKQFLEEKTRELADKLDIPIQEFDKDGDLNEMSIHYAQYRLRNKMGERYASGNIGV